MRYPPLIGISGAARSGKDTAADFIQVETGGYIYHLADPMRAMLRVGLGIDLDTQYWRERKEEVVGPIGKSPRQLMQTLGTEWGRNMISEDLWLVMAQIQLMKRGPGMIIPDIRFENEAKWLRDRGGVIVHLRRKDAQKVNEHVSESGVTPALGEVTISNDGTLQDLQVSIGEWIGGYQT
jgi:hypothetical protein